MSVLVDMIDIYYRYHIPYINTRPCKMKLSTKMIDVIGQPSSPLLYFMLVRCEVWCVCVVFAVSTLSHQVLRSYQLSVVSEPAGDSELSETSGQQRTLATGVTVSQCHSVTVSQSSAGLENFSVLDETFFLKENLEEKYIKSWIRRGKMEISRVNCSAQCLYQVLVLSVLVSFITQTSGLRWARNN